MGDVVAFALKPGRVRRKRKHPEGKTAILFFTGVRYERPVPSELANGKPGPQRPRRRRA